MKDKTVKMKVGKLLINYNLYPRGKVDGTRIQRLREKRAAGIDLDPMTADAKTKQVTDGVHRTTLYLRDEGPDYETDVILRDYPDEWAMLADAAAMNLRGPKPLDSHDMMRVSCLAEDMGVSIAQVAGALSITVSTLQTMRDERIAVVGPQSKGNGKGKSAARRKGSRIPLKEPFRHLAGKRLTPEQVEANEKGSGMRPTFHANQLIRAIKAGMLQMEDESLLAKLRELHELLESLFAATK